MDFSCHISLQCEAPFPPAGMVGSVLGLKDEADEATGVHHSIQRCGSHLASVGARAAAREDSAHVALVPNTIEYSDAVISAGHCLAVEDTRARMEAGESIRDQREAPCEIVAGTAVEAHAKLGLTGDDPNAIVLDLMYPCGADRWLWGIRGKARLDEAGRQGTRMRGHGRS